MKCVVLHILIFKLKFVLIRKTKICYNGTIYLKKISNILFYFPVDILPEICIYKGFEI